MNNRNYQLMSEDNYAATYINSELLCLFRLVKDYCNWTKATTNSINIKYLKHTLPNKYVSVEVKDLIAFSACAFESNSSIISTPLLCVVKYLSQYYNRFFKNTTRMSSNDHLEACAKEFKNLNRYSPFFVPEVYFSLLNDAVYFYYCDFFDNGSQYVRESSFIDPITFNSSTYEQQYLDEFERFKLTHTNYLTTLDSSDLDLDDLSMIEDYYEKRNISDSPKKCVLTMINKTKDAIKKFPNLNETITI